MANNYPIVQQTRRTFFLRTLAIAGILSLAQAGNIQAGTLHGKIIYHGPLPDKEEIVVKKDSETCGKTREVEPIILAQNKGVQDVIVSVEMEGQDSPAKDPGQPRAIVNKGCRFLARVGTATVKQTLTIQNLDPILHNTHVRTSTRAFINVVLLPEAMGVKKTLRKPGPMTVKCNKHPFMKGFIHVFSHPYHTVTDSTGHFMLLNLPEGTHTLSFWHETLGTLQQTVTLPQKDGTILNIEFPTP